MNRMIITHPSFSNLRGTFLRRLNDHSWSSLIECLLEDGRVVKLLASDWYWEV